MILPTQLLELAKQGKHPTGYVALDTETSGLHIDDNARMSAISIAFVDENNGLTEHIPLGLWDNGSATKQTHQIGNQQVPIISLAWPLDQGLTGTGKPEDTNQGALFPEADNLPLSEWQALKDWLQLLGERGPYLTMHHSKFDLMILRAGIRGYEHTKHGAGIELEPQTAWDTQNVAHLLWSYHGTTSLKPTSTREFGEDLEDEQQKVKEYLRKKKLPTGRWDLIPWDIVGPYADLDARLTLRLTLHQQWLLSQGAADWLDGTKRRMNAKQAIERRMNTTRMLYRMEKRGLPYDSSQVGKVTAELRKRIQQLEQELPFKPATLPGAKHYWFGEGTNKHGTEGLGLRPVAVTEKGEPQLNAHVVRKLAVREVPGINTWRNLQKAKTANDRWYSGWGSMVGDDGRLRGNVRQNGTVSGRFSISRVQLQAIPHDFRLDGFEVLEGIPTPRGMIGAGVQPGYKLWELDLANAELRVAAMMAKCTRMLQLIHEGKDLHGDAATQLFDVQPDDPNWGQMRNVAKRANFSLIFGVGWEKLQEDIDVQTGIVLSDSETQQLVLGWNALYPQYQQAIHRTSRVVKNRQIKHGVGWIQGPNGERRWFTQDEQVHKAFNQRVQSALAQFGNDWWLSSDQKIQQQLTEAGYEDQLDKIGLVMLIHDSMVLLLPEQDELDERIVQSVVDDGVAIWSQWFPSVPGGVDAEPW